MSDKAIVDVIRRVYDGNEGASVLVGVCGDGLMVEVKTSPDKVSKEWFGENRISFSPKVARAVAEAMAKCADELDEQEGK